MKIQKKAFTVLAVLIFALLSFYLFFMRPRRVTPILMYHAINKNGNGTLSVTPENFSRQMEFLHKSGYSVISLDALVRNIEKGIRFIPRTVVITFDDGYEDNYLHAFPVLAKYHMPATVFLITGYVDEREGYIKWDQVRVMMQNGIDFGGHTRSDVYLPSVKDTRRLWEEVAGCRKDIELMTSKEARYFSYPIGGFDRKVKNAVRRAGYKGACTTNRGFDKLNRDVYELNRIKITNSDMNRPFHFRAKLSGYYNLFRHMKRGH